MIGKLLATVFLGIAAAQTTPNDVLTAESLRAFLSSSGMFESNARLIHMQMQQQRTRLPAWWPDDVYASEEAAIQKVDVIDAALPFYQGCLTDRQTRVLTKIVLSKAGQQVAQAAMRTHSQAAEQGDSPMNSQIAGEDAAVRTERSMGSEEKQKAVASLTPTEQAFAAREFTPAKYASIRECMNTAFAKLVPVMKAQQEEALHTVVEANRPRLDAAKAQWEKAHLDAAQ